MTADCIDSAKRRRYGAAAFLNPHGELMVMFNDVLFLVEGEELSEQVKERAKEAKFAGQIVTLSLKEARLQRTPLPLLIAEGTSFGPNLLRDLFGARPLR